MIRERPPVLNDTPWHAMELVPSDITMKKLQLRSLGLLRKEYSLSAIQRRLSAKIALAVLICHRRNVDLFGAIATTVESSELTAKRLSY